jgi:hypothetical protein
MRIRPGRLAEACRYAATSQAYGTGQDRKGTLQLHVDTLKDAMATRAVASEFEAAPSRFTRIKDIVE